MDNATAARMLRQEGWLSHVPDEFATAVLGLCHWRRVEAGQSIQHAGDGEGRLYGLAAGTVSMTTAMTAPDCPITDIGHPGSWFGFVPLFGGKALVTTVEARTDIVLAVLAPAPLTALFDQHPGWWRHIGMLGINYGHIAANIAGDLMIRDSRRRCVAALLRLGNCRFADRGGSTRAEAPLSQSELAGIANLSRTSVNVILGKLEADGLISLGYRCIYLLDTGALRAIADEG
jgi:CRP/FNR family cyclic AMP-dependent transcriptional regulator